MAPQIFDFNGIKILFYSNEHYPIHIHAKYNDFETVYELLFKNGKLFNINVRQTNKPMLPAQQNKKVIKFIKKYNLKIVDKWQKYIILKKKVTLTKITNL